MRILIVLAALLAAAPASARRLPKHRPADFTASYSITGGMAGGGEHATLAAAGTFERYPHGGEGGDQKADFTMSDDELDKLYAALRAAGADRVHVVKRKGTLYDAGSTSFTITAGGHTWSVGDDANHQIAKKDLAKLEASIEAMQGAIVDKVPPPEAPVNQELQP